MDRRFIILSLLAGLVLCTVGQESSFVPVNGQMYRLRQPDGTVRMFLRDDDEPNLLHGEGGWTAEIDGRKTLVMNDADQDKDRRGFLFLNGYLRKQLVGDREIDVRVPPPGSDAKALAELWPAMEARLVAAEPPDIWSGGPRIRLWFDNPNKAGLLFAEIALAALALLFCKPIWLRIVGAAVSLVSFIGLVQTSSRGALLAFLCGVAAIGVVRFKSMFTVKRMLVVAAVIVVAVGCLFASGQFERLGKNLFNEGQRETSRLTVWKEVPRMMVDAPDGWGFGQSARAYIDWYQPQSVCLLKNLISDHLTFLVEAGWPLRFAYVFLWLAIGGVLAWLSVQGASPVPMAIVVAFAVAGCFNPVVFVPELWLIPVTAILGLAILRFHDCFARRMLVPVALAALFTVLAAVGVCIWGSAVSPKVSVHKTGGAVCLNGENPSIWVVDDDYVLHGGYWWLTGRELRDSLESLKTPSPLGYVRSVADLPKDADVIVFLGEAGRDFLELQSRPGAKKVVFLSPPFSWQTVPESLLSTSEVSFVLGGLAARRIAGEASPPSWVTIVPGSELYVPNWLKFVL